MMARASFFASHNLLLGLPYEFASRLMINAPTISLATGNTLFEIGEQGDGCYLLEEGVLKVSIPSNEGTERILAILGAGAIVGELAMIDGLPRSATIQALRDSKLTYLARSTFLKALHDHPELNGHLVSTLVARLRQADDEVAAASFLPLKARVARALLQFARHLGEPTDSPDRVVLRYRLRQNDVAALADVARESASRILSDWKRRKIVDQQSRMLFVIDTVRLEREAETAR